MEEQKEVETNSIQEQLLRMGITSIIYKDNTYDSNDMISGGCTTNMVVHRMKTNPNFYFIVVNGEFLWLVPRNIVMNSSYIQNKLNGVFQDSTPNKWNDETNTFDQEGTGSPLLIVDIPEEIQMSSFIILELGKIIKNYFEIPSCQWNRQHKMILYLILDEPYKSILDFLGFEINYESINEL